MKTGHKALLASALLPILLIVGCTEEAPLPPPESRPVKTMIIGGIAAGDMRQFPGVVDAIQKADMSFRVAGKLNQILVREGEQIKKDQLIATLDPTDFEIVLKDREASYKTAKANYDRAKELIAKDAISRVDHDNLRAQYFTAEANLRAAKQDMSYTKLKAKFDGYVAKRYVENYEEVLAKQAIISLQDVSELEIKVDVPETLMIQLRKHEDINIEKQPPRNLYSVFDQIKGQKFPLTLKEISTTADINTRTFKATLKMKNPEGFNVLPGMTATVFAEVFPDETAEVTSVELPISAVVSDPEKKSVVWVVDESTMTVHSKPVTLGLITTDRITVDGLEPGQRIVTAGAAFLREGMKVTLLVTGEQPE